MSLQTEYEFTLPRGYVDRLGNIHRQGVMRLATALDEIEPLRDARVRANQAYLSILLLARVIVKLGDLPAVSTSVVESLFAGDMAYLQAFYRQINEQGVTTLEVVCPTCQHKTEVDLAGLGGIYGYPLTRLHEEVAYIAFHFHWTLAAILALEHHDRLRWVEEIARLNRRLNAMET